MFFGELKNIACLKHYSSNLDKAILFLEKADLTSLPLGKTLIDNDSVFITKSEIITKDESLLLYEQHKKYLDIHIIVEGDEIIGLTMRPLEILERYNENNDSVLYKYSIPENKLALNNNNCLLIFPGEAHMPGIIKNSSRILKCVVKVLAN